MCGVVRGGGGLILKRDEDVRLECGVEKLLWFFEFL